MAEKLIDNGEQTLLRFQCDCLDPAHALDVSIDKLTGDVVVDFANSYSAGQTSLWHRLKAAFAILRGQRVCLADFILRPEDRRHLSNVLWGDPITRGSGTKTAYFPAQPANHS